MAGRTSQAGRRRAARNARAEVARARARPTGAWAVARPLASLGFIGAGVAGLWMGLAHALGWVVRAIGRQAATAKELDREHRRDGGGLLLIGIAIVLAVAVWFGGAGPFGHWLATTTRMAVGAIAMALPLLLLVRRRSGSCASHPMRRTAAGAWSAGPRSSWPAPGCCTSASGSRPRRR